MSSFSINKKEISPILLTYDYEKITNAISIESLLRSKLNYDNSEWTG